TDLKGSQGFLARHDGYVQRFGFLHEREMKLSSNGNVLTGRDRFQRPGGAAIRNNGRDFVAVRFHVHPDINLLQDEHDRLVLAADQGDTWVFTCAG
ncbi:MAG: heparinase, partial [Mesorhizobium sp.]